MQAQQPLRQRLVILGQAALNKLARQADGTCRVYELIRLVENRVIEGMEALEAIDGSTYYPLQELQHATSRAALGQPPIEFLLDQAEADLFAKVAELDERCSKCSWSLQDLKNKTENGEVIFTTRMHQRLGVVEHRLGELSSLSGHACHNHHAIEYSLKRNEYVPQLKASTKAGMINLFVELQPECDEMDGKYDQDNQVSTALSIILDTLITRNDWKEDIQNNQKKVRNNVMQCS